MTWGGRESRRGLRRCSCGTKQARTSGWVGGQVGLAARKSNGVVSEAVDLGGVRDAVEAMARANEACREGEWAVGGRTACDGSQRT